MKAWLAIFFAGLVLLSSGMVSAAPSLRERLSGDARVAFERGLALHDAKDSRAALAQFLIAYDLSREPRLLVNLAVVERDLGHYARGLTLLGRALEEGAGALSGVEKAKIKRSMATFRALTAPLSARSEPPGADVLIDGVQVGKTPLPPDSRIDLGRRRVVMKLAGRREAEQSLEVTGPVDLSLDLEPQVQLGRLEIGVKPEITMTSVAVDGVPRGMAPVTLELPIGPHRVSVARPGYVAVARDVDVRFGEITRTTLDLRPDIARLLVTGVADDADVLLDGRAMARGNFEGDVRAGTRRLEIKSDDEVRFATDLFLRPGERRTVTAPERSSRLGWWVALGAVAVGGAVSAAVLLNRDDPPGSIGAAGSLNPNRVSVPVR